VLLIANSTFEMSASASRFAIGNLVEVCDSTSLKVRETAIEEKKLEKSRIFLVDDVKIL
jgi:hypothetical protein